MSRLSERAWQLEQAREMRRCSMQALIRKCLQYSNAKSSVSSGLGSRLATEPSIFSSFASRMSNSTSTRSTDWESFSSFSSAMELKWFKNLAVDTMKWLISAVVFRSATGCNCERSTRHCCGENENTTSNKANGCVDSDRLYSADDYTGNCHFLYYLLKKANLARIRDSIHLFGWSCA